MNTLETLRREANQKAVQTIIEAKPFLMGVMRAGEFLKNLDKHTILHSGPPIEYEDMCELHQNGMKNACLLENWATTLEEADSLLRKKEIKVDSAFNYPTVGSGTGIITPSVPLWIVEDRVTGNRAGVFPAEGKYGGGFCGWGVFSEPIRQNLFYMRDHLFAELSDVLQTEHGMYIGDVIAQSIEMGDENHSSQTAVDALFIRKIIPYALRCSNSSELLMYFAETGRFFHNLGQAASRAALLGAEGIDHSTMVTCAGGNGVEYGIQVAGLPGQWFTGPSPMIEGQYMVKDARKEDQLPWIGDSSVVECAGLGGILSAASPKVCSFRNESFMDGIKTTERMMQITIGSNPSYRIPNMRFAESPVGIDCEKVVETGILPVIDGGMINRQGGWMGAGYANIPMVCFTKAMAAIRDREKLAGFE